MKKAVPGELRDQVDLIISRSGTLVLSGLELERLIKTSTLSWAGKAIGNKCKSLK